MVLCQQSLPYSVMVDSLLRVGSFSSPIFREQPVLAASSLIKSLHQELGIEMPLVEADLKQICQMLSDYAVLDKVAVQLIFHVPGQKNRGYSALTNLFHTDFPGNLGYPVIRLVRVYAGKGTEWLSSSNVNRNALQAYMSRVGEFYNTQKPCLTEELLKINKKIPKNHHLINTVPDGWVSIRKRGISNEIVHRAPRDNDPRLLLIIDEISR